LYQLRVVLGAVREVVILYQLRILDSRQGAAADEDVGVDREFFVVDLGGKLDADASRRVRRRLRKRSLSSSVMHMPTSCACNI
jgi:hypothetical protein